MTVKELIKLLKTFDPDRLVVLASDPESNYHYKVREVGEAAFDKKDGSIHIEELTKELVRAGFTEEDINPDAVPCVVVMP